MDELVIDAVVVLEMIAAAIAPAMATLAGEEFDARFSAAEPLPLALIVLLIASTVMLLNVAGASNSIVAPAMDALVPIEICEIDELPAASRLKPPGALPAASCDACFAVLI